MFISKFNITTILSYLFLIIILISCGNEGKTSAYNKKLKDNEKDSIFNSESSGQIKSIQETFSGTWESAPETFYLYNEKGNLINREETFTNRQEILKGNYDDSGKLIEELRYEVDSETGKECCFKKKQFFYDEQGKLISHELFYGDRYIEKTSYSYNNRNKLIEEHTIRGKDSIFTTYYYDSRSRLLKKQEEDNYYRGFKTTYIWHYDKNGNYSKQLFYEYDNLIEEIKFVFDNNNNLLEKHLDRKDNYAKSNEINRYNEFDDLIEAKGELTAIIDGVEDKSGYDYEYEYKYDESNNWILKKKIRKGKIIEEWKRTLKYY